MRRRWLAVALPLLLAAGCRNQNRYIAVAMDAPGVDAAKLGAKQVNSEGGVDGRHRLKIRPFRMSPTTSAAQLLDSLKVWAEDTTVVAVVVSPWRASTAQVSQVLDGAKVPYLLAAPAPVLTPPSPYRFYLAPTVDDEAGFMAARAAARGTGTKVAIFYADADYGVAARNALVQRLGRAGIQVVAEQKFPLETDEPQLLGLATQLTEPKPDLVFWFGPIEELTIVLPTLEASLPQDGRVIASSRAETRHLYFNPEGFFNGLEFVRPVNIADPDSAMKNFLFVAGSWAGGETRATDIMLYDGVRMLGTGLRESGTPNRASLQKYLAELGRGRPAYKGLVGDIAFLRPGPSTPWPLDLGHVSGPRVMSALADEEAAAAERTFEIRVDSQP